MLDKELFKLIKEIYYLITNMFLIDLTQHIDFIDFRLYISFSMFIMDEITDVNFFALNKIDRLKIQIYNKLEINMIFPNINRKSIFIRNQSTHNRGNRYATFILMPQKNIMIFDYEQSKILQNRGIDEKDWIKYLELACTKLYEFKLKSI